MPKSDSGTRLQSIAIPAEHGGWSLTLEPALLGLLVRPSPAGVVLMLAGLLAFVARTPLKLAVGDRIRRRRLARTVVADRLLAVESVVLAALVVVAIILAEAPFWEPLVVAAPLIVIGLWYDVRAKSRRFAAEIAGTIGIAGIGAAVVMAGGGEPSLAYGVWLVAAARSLAAVAYVRVQLRRAKVQPFKRATSDVAQVVSVAFMVVGTASGVLPVAAPIAIGALAVFHGLALRCCAAPKAAVLGAQQVVWGLTIVLVVGLAMIAPTNP
jgi:hypothetical protein